MLEQFRHLAGYNAWANTRLYDAAARLTDEQLWRDVGLFFGSLGGTLNHILVADRVWMKRFTGTGDHPDKLNAILHRDLPTLRAERDREDARIIAYADQLSAERLDQTFTYR
ncbi:MAG TPA: DinB family protein, partial [Hyphomonadaceae bacterium]